MNWPKRWLHRVIDVALLINIFRFTILCGQRGEILVPRPMAMANRRKLVAARMGVNHIFFFGKAMGAHSTARFVFGDRERWEPKRPATKAYRALVKRNWKL